MTASPERGPLGPTLPISTSTIQLDELVKAVRTMKLQRACGEDKVPAEFWRAVLDDSGEAAAWLLDFCRLCWDGACIPMEWHCTRVAAIFKKVDPAECKNYRPISLLNVGYKIYARVLLNRLRLGGAEQHIWPTQFGFRSKRGTTQALLMARSYIEQACSARDGQIMLLALDWAKAFDSIDPNGLVRALQRFGLPQKMVEVVQNIYSHRKFLVRDCGVESRHHTQSSGIVQGCPLSPFLFTIVMTCIMTDARAQLTELLGPDEAKGMKDLLYADDTLLIGASSQSLAALVQAVADVGAEYGLTLHVDKTQLLSVRGPATLHLQDGNEIANNLSMVYLGGLLHADGKGDHELSRRIGLAAADFKSLTRLWRHSYLGTRRKIEIFNACVVSVLRYGLETVWLGKVARRRLDGFQARCLRKILKMPHAYYSRVTNETVLQTARCTKLSRRLFQDQLVLFGKIASGEHDALRAAFFEESSLELVKADGPRTRGRPIHTWTGQTMKHALGAAGGSEKLKDILLVDANIDAWQRIVNRYVEALPSQTL